MEEDAPFFLKLQKSIKIVDPTEHFVIDGIDFTKKFLKYQEDSVKLADTNGFVMETHPHEILSLSSVLLLKPNQHSELLLQHISSGEINKLHERIVEEACGSKGSEVEFDLNATAEITKVAKV